MEQMAVLVSFPPHRLLCTSLCVGGMCMSNDVFKQKCDYDWDSQIAPLLKAHRGFNINYSFIEKKLSVPNYVFQSF